MGKVQITGTKQQGEISWFKYSTPGHIQVPAYEQSSGFRLAGECTKQKCGNSIFESVMA